MENLNKNNFFNLMEGDHAEAVAHFKAWVSEYEESVDFNRLFNVGFWKGEMYREGQTEAPTFTDLPHEFQIGIVLRYIAEQREVNNFPRVTDTQNILIKAFQAFRPKKNEST